MNFNESTETNLSKCVRLRITRGGKDREKERERERGREICNSSVASHRWWVEASSGAPKLARIKGGFKTSAEHQSSNQGTAATMRAFVVSSPSTTISRFPDFSFPFPLSSSLFSVLLLLLLLSRHCFFFNPLCFSSRAYTGDFSEDERTVRETRRIRRDRDRNRDRDRDRGFHPRAGGGRTREKVKERGGCAGSIVCGVNVLLDSD